MSGVRVGSRQLRMMTARLSLGSLGSRNSLPKTFGTSVVEDPFMPDLRWWRAVVNAAENVAVERRHRSKQKPAALLLVGSSARNMVM